MHAAGQRSEAHPAGSARRRQPRGTSLASQLQQYSPSRQAPTTSLSRSGRACASGGVGRRGRRKRGRACASGYQYAALAAHAMSNSESAACHRAESGRGWSDVSPCQTIQRRPGCPPVPAKRYESSRIAREVSVPSGVKIRRELGAKRSARTRRRFIMARCRRIFSGSSSTGDDKLSVHRHVWVWRG